MCHSSFWPVEGIDVRGKKVGVVGNGATGIQIAQTLAREADQLNVFIRTPNTCIPMSQGPLDPEQAKKDLPMLGDQLGKERYLNAGGFLYSGTGKNGSELTAEEREQAMEEAFRLGGFRIIFAFNDVLIDETTNRHVYDFWARKTRARITDPVKRDILAPLEPPHPFAGKRPSLEQDCKCLTRYKAQSSVGLTSFRLRADG